MMPMPVFSDPNSDKGSKILAITGSFTAFACLVVMLRLYVRTFLLKTVGADDYVMIVAMYELFFSVRVFNWQFLRLCSAGVLACFIGEVHNGVGHHITHPKLLENMMTIFHWSWFHGWVNVIGISSVKISIGLFLLRLVQGKWYNVIVSDLHLDCSNWQQVPANSGWVDYLHHHFHSRLGRNVVSLPALIHTMIC